MFFCYSFSNINRIFYHILPEISKTFYVWVFDTLQNPDRVDRSITSHLTIDKLFSNVKISIFLKPSELDLSYSNICQVYYRHKFNVIWRMFKKKKLCELGLVKFLKTQVCICFDNQLKNIVIWPFMVDNVSQIKDKRSKSKKLKLFSSTALNSKVRPQILLEHFNPLI